MFELRPYQKTMVQDTHSKLSLYDSVLNQSATGSGKTVIMSSFIKEWIVLNPGKKILIQVHRDELVGQTSETLAKFGILTQKITAKSKPDYSQDIFVGMTETISSRKIKLDIALLVIDEAHVQNFKKTFELFPNAKRVGFTATPIINKRINYYKCSYCDKKNDTRIKCCFNESMQKWSAPVTMSETYNDINVGIPIADLITENSLVDELVFTYDYYSELSAKGEDEFDENEIAEESAKHDSNVLQEYEEKAKGKKTMIFTASTKQNVSLLNTFSNYKVKSYDTVNKENREDRKDIVEWFKNTDGAILISTGTFTTGFDVKEVECIIVNRPTSSLSLWHQIIGRGARPSDKIYKDHFIVIDLGGNVKRLGKWSDKLDWETIFFIGLKPAKQKKEIIVQCQKCSWNWMGQNSDPCPNEIDPCGHINEPITKQRSLLPGDVKELEVTEKKTTNISVVPIPNGQKIAEFVRRTTDNKNDYYNIIIEKYVDLWKLNRVESEIYFNRVKNGQLEVKIKEYLQKNYRYVNQLKNGVPRTYKYLEDKIKEKLKKCYI